MVYEPGKIEVEKAILVALAANSRERERVSESLDELARLAFTAGAEVIDRRLQVRSRPTPNFYVGKGLVEEINTLAVRPELTYCHQWRPRDLGIWDNRCLMIGWVVDKWWGGRLLFRELSQKNDGTLALGWVPEMTRPQGEEHELAERTGSATVADHEWSLGAEEGSSAWHAFALPAGDQKLSFRFRPGPGCAAFGINLRAGADYRGGRELRLDPQRQEARWGTPRDGRLAPAVDSPRCHAEDFAIGDVEGLCGDVTVQVMLRDWVVDAWINGERTIVTRSHDATGDWLYIFVESGEVCFAPPVSVSVGD